MSSVWTTGGEVAAEGLGRVLPHEHVFINEMREVHRLTNKSKVTYLSRLIEMKAVTWTAT